eukprot:TRINITY_DN5729_c0_g1_i2.p5 TRINITY_DN5729_c0_g1~~TRINITY_DN5729_c0_g1_i2.p5  ORF type:complete len:124 (-),score=8.50 TRINITY_DN5729_c0_g1_i2:23-394(-)
MFCFYQFGCFVRGVFQWEKDCFFNLHYFMNYGIIWWQSGLGGTHLFFFFQLLVKIKKGIRYPDQQIIVRNYVNVVILVQQKLWKVYSAKKDDKCKNTVANSIVGFRGLYYLSILMQEYILIIS